MRSLPWRDVTLFGKRTSLAHLLAFSRILWTFCASFLFLSFSFLHASAFQYELVVLECELLTPPSDQDSQAQGDLFVSSQLGHLKVSLDQEIFYPYREDNGYKVGSKRRVQGFEFEGLRFRVLGLKVERVGFINPADCAFVLQADPRRDAGPVHVPLDTLHSSHVWLPLSIFSSGLLILLTQHTLHSHVVCLQIHSVHSKGPFQHQLLYCSPPMYGSHSVEAVTQWMVYHRAYAGFDHFIFYDAGTRAMPFLYMLTL